MLHHLVDLLVTGIKKMSSHHKLDIWQVTNFQWNVSRVTFNDSFFTPKLCKIVPTFNATSFLSNFTIIKKLFLNLKRKKNWTNFSDCKFMHDRINLNVKNDFLPFAKNKKNRSERIFLFDNVILWKHLKYIYICKERKAS